MYVCKYVYIIQLPEEKEEILGNTFSIKICIEKKPRDAKTTTTTIFSQRATNSRTRAIRPNTNWSEVIHPGQTDRQTYVQLLARTNDVISIINSLQIFFYKSFV